MKNTGFKNLDYRGKKVNSNEWVKGYLSFDFGKRPIIHNHLIQDEEFQDAYNTEGFEVEPDSVGLSTGILDKENKEIFSGDVYRTEREFLHGNVIEHFICTWLKEFGCFSFLSESTYYDYIDNGLPAIEWMLDDGFPIHIDFEDCKQIKIIGNVYDMWVKLFSILEQE